MNILLIGCGRTGRAITNKLIERKDIEKIYLYSRTSKNSKSLSYDLESSKIKVVKSVKSLKDKNIDFVIISISGMSDSARDESIWNRNSTYKIRQDKLKYNMGAIVNLVEDLKEYPESTSIIVVTNPVDELTNYMRIMLNKANIIGFGMQLDVERYKKYLGKNVKCIGAHGNAIPLLKESKTESYNKILKDTDKALLDYIKIHGIPHAMAGISFKNFFDKINANRYSELHLSYYLKDDFLGIKEISISLPWIVGKGKVVKPAKIEVNNIEKNKFLYSVKDLKKSINKILIVHENLITYH